MKIAIDAIGIHYVGGGRTAVLNFLQPLLEIDQSNQYLICLTQPEPSLTSKAGNVRQFILPVKNRFAVRAYAQVMMPILMRGYDLVHFSKNLGLFGPLPPSVVTVFDLTTLIHPELFPKFDVWYWQTVEKKTLHRAARIIAISEATAQDLVKFYSLPEHKIKVIYPSIDQRFKPVSQADILHAREKYHLPEGYILHLGRIDVKKKLSLLVEAYSLAKSMMGENFTDRLVMVGEVYAKSQDDTLLPTIRKLGVEDDVIFTGRVPDADLPAIISGAKIAVSVSVHEGFGLSAIESMACGTPLIAYRAGALQEAVGEAALLLDNLNPENIADALKDVITRPDLRAELSQKGMLRAQRYQGRQNALQTLQLYEEIYHENH